MDADCRPVGRCGGVTPAAGAGAALPAALGQLFFAAAAMRLSICAAGMAPGARVPSSNTTAGVPCTLYLRPISTFCSMALLSQLAAALDGSWPSTIHARQALATSLAHQMSLLFTLESGPRIG